MRLSSSDVARILDVSENTLFRWAERGEIPHSRIDDHFFFNRTELIEWATSRGMRFSSELVARQSLEGSGRLSLAKALSEGGIWPAVEGTTREEVLRSVVQTMRLPSGVAPEFLYEMLMVREDMGSTALGEGIAIPHARMPVVLRVAIPYVSLSYLVQPIPFGALDGIPVSALFTIVSPNIKAHLALLAMLSFALRDNAFKKCIMSRAPAAAVLCEAARIDGLLAATPVGSL